MSPTTASHLSIEFDLVTGGPCRRRQTTCGRLPLIRRRMGPWPAWAPRLHCRIPAAPLKGTCAAVVRAPCTPPRGTGVLPPRTSAESPPKHTPCRRLKVPHAAAWSSPALPMIPVGFLWRAATRSLLTFSSDFLTESGRLGLPYYWAKRPCSVLCSASKSEQWGAATALVSRRLDLPCVV
jgi:hypothetical protein